MNCKISIVTIVYNGEFCIQKTIESVLEQSYKNIEYIIVDGISNYSTIKIIEKYNDKIDKIISEKDDGIYDAMNKGLGQVTGDYVVFMNCDDTFFSNNTVSEIADCLDANNFPSFLYGDSIEKSSIDGSMYFKKARDPKYLWYGMFTHHQSMLYKMSVVRSHNLKYDLQYEISSDYKFTAEFLKYTKDVVYIENPLCVFMQDGASAVNYKIGLKEQLKIRKSTFKYNILTRFLIFSVHYCIIMIRKTFPSFYNILRFRKKK